MAWSDGAGGRAVSVTPPPGRKVVFVGDLVDRGPRTPDVLRIAMHMEEAGSAYVVMGNHDRKLDALASMAATSNRAWPPAVDRSARSGGPRRSNREAKTFLDGCAAMRGWTAARLAVAHAGLKEEMIGRGSGAVREFALFGETTGEIDEFGLPVRATGPQSIEAVTSVIYGHVATSEIQWVNNTLCIDTGCVYGGKLTALRWPEKEIVSVPAAKVYYEPSRPLAPAPEQRSAQAECRRYSRYGRCERPSLDRHRA